MQTLIRIAMDPLGILTISVTLFMILDPFASLPMFISMTKGLDGRTVKSYANKAILVAAILLFVFMLMGPKLMSVFDVSMSSFKVAGGIIFLMMAIELVFGLKLSQISNDSGAKWAIIASPVLTGPGVITTAIIYSQQYGMDTVAVAGVIALIATWAILRMSSSLMKAVGEQALGVVTRIIGLFIAAMGVESIFSGSLSWFTDNTANILLMML